MTRSVPAVLLILLPLAACYGDLVSTREPSGGGGDGAGTGGVDSGAAPGPDAALIPGDADLTCAEMAAPIDGHHREGETCRSCHGSTPLPGANTFTVSGTLYDGTGGGAPVGGVFVTVIDSNQNRIDMVSGTNGNFWTEQAVAFPLVTYASSCPDLVPMMQVVSDGDCNAVGCHGTGNRIFFAP
jgi:hypothetical protein